MESSTIICETGGPDFKLARLAHSATTVVHFLDMLSVSAPNLSTTFEDSVALLALAEHFQALTLIPIIKDRLYSNDDSGQGPIALFLLGSARDDWEIGKMAVSNLSTFWVKRLPTRY